MLNDEVNNLQPVQNYQLAIEPKYIGQLEKKLLFFLIFLLLQVKLVLYVLMVVNHFLMMEQNIHQYRTIYDERNHRMTRP
jgi:hypothetical protein